MFTILFSLHKKLNKETFFGNGIKVMLKFYNWIGK